MGYFNEELLPVVHFPKVGGKKERHIGAFFIAWNTLEHELDISFPVLFRVDATLAGCIYSNLGTRLKLDILSSAIDSLSPLLGSRLAKSAHGVLDRVKSLIEARTTLAHGQIGKFFDEEKKRTDWKLMRLIARKQQSIIFHASDAKALGRLTSAVRSVTNAWHQKCLTMHARLKTFSDDDLESRVQIHMKVAEPIRLRRHKNRSPKKRGFRAHPPKHGK